MTTRTRLATAFIAMILCASVTIAQTTTFTYQGKLNDAAVSANGPYDFTFKLYDASSGGSQIGSNVVVNDANVIAGIFTVNLDFGATAFTEGSIRFLQIDIRPGASTGAFTPLSPRQEIKSAPYAMKSQKSTTSDQLGGIAANQFVQTNDSRLTDSRNPLPGSSNYIQNSTTAQNASFNINGNGTATGPSTGFGLRGVSSGGNGIEGQSTTGNGVSGTGDTGVRGFGATTGVLGFTDSATGRGVSGSATSGGYGVFGVSNSGTGVFGQGNGSSPGVDGRSSTGRGVDGTGNVGVSGRGAIIGVQGFIDNDGIGVFGSSTGSGNGVRGVSNTGTGVLGQSNGSSPGVDGRSSSGPGVFGRSVSGNAGEFDGTVVIFGNLLVAQYAAGTANHVCFGLGGILSVCSSSIRYKEGVTPFTSGLDLVRRLRPVTYNWKTTGATDIGLIAEEVAKVEPQLTTRNEKGEIEGVKYDQLSAVFINAFKEQQEQIDRQQRFIAKLEQRLARLERRVKGKNGSRR